MIHTTNELITELNNLTVEHLRFTAKLKELPEEVLQQKPNQDSWSILECIEHLNLYGVFYLPEIEKRMNASSKKASTTFKSGFLGNKFALDMLPKENMKTMKTFKSKNPIHTTLVKNEVLETFLNQQKGMLKLLELSRDKNLNAIKTSTTLPFLKFKLGDTFRFVIYHNERHIVQVKNILKSR